MRRILTAVPRLLDSALVAGVSLKIRAQALDVSEIPALTLETKRSAWRTLQP